MNGHLLAHTAHALDTDIILAVPPMTVVDLTGMIGIVMTDDTDQGGAHDTGAVALIDVNARPIATGKRKNLAFAHLLTFASHSVVDVVVIDPSLLRYHKKKGTGVQYLLLNLLNV